MSDKTDKKATRARMPPGPARKAAAQGESSRLTEGRLRLSLRQLEVFAATARAGSTRAAGERVARSQSAASSSLTDLEAVLGVALFDRVGRRLRLNENGRAMLPKAQELLDRAGELEGQFGGDGHVAPLSVASSFTVGEYLLPSLVMTWTQAHPGSRIHLQIANTHDVIEAVARFDVELGFIEGPGTHRDIAVHTWSTDELVIIAAAHHPLAGRIATARELARATWVLRERGSGTRQAADAWLTRHLPQVIVGLELGSTEAIKQVVASGFGLGCLSRHAVAQALTERRLAEIHTRLPKAERMLSAIRHRDKAFGRTTLAFLEHCGVVSVPGP